MMTMDDGPMMVMAMIMIMVMMVRVHGDGDGLMDNGPVTVTVTM